MVQPGRVAGGWLHASRADGAAWDAESVEARLLEAGRTLMALHVPGVWPAGVRSAMPNYLRDADEAYGWDGEEPRVGPPSPRAIAAMDQALSWIACIPADRLVFRRIVGARLLCRPEREPPEPMLGWRRIARQVGASHEAVRQWHAQAIGLIVDALNRPGLCALSGGPARSGDDADVEGALRRMGARAARRNAGKACV